MTPQLQQAIRLLQLSSVELQTEIQDALESNMMLELDEGEDEEPETGYREQNDNQNDIEAVLKETPSNEDDIPNDLPVDTAWDDIYEGGISYARNGGDEDDYNGYDSRSGEEKTLREHLLWQLNLTPTSETDRAIATAIIDALDDDGYLTCSLEDIQNLMGQEPGVELDEVEAILHLVQAMEPAGVGARDLKECLKLQLAQADPDTSRLGEARRLVDEHLDLLASHDYGQLMRKLKLPREDLSEVISLIQSLNPRPGGLIHDQAVQYVIPDVYVKKIGGVWRVELNTEAMPRLRINSGYAHMIKRADNSSDNTSMKAHLQEARWFIKSLQSRSETLLRVASCIVERQRAFLEYGEEAMKPLVLHDIAEELDMHESTISRVTTRKYMHTPRGVFELKYFFSSHVSTNEGGTASSTAIRALIKKLIGGEQPQKPLSDSKIASLLGEQGINVARRTVAKYREAMSIPPSNERKRLF